jgi:hypothetical protein
LERKGESWFWPDWNNFRMAKVDFGPTKMDRNEESRFLLDWNGLEWWRSVLSWEVVVWPEWNGLKWRESVFGFDLTGMA